jgi:hypothetical protein
MRFHFIERDRPPEQVSLKLVALIGLKQHHLLRRFDAFRCHRHFQGAAEGNDRLYNRARRALSFKR